MRLRNRSTGLSYTGNKPSGSLRHLDDYRGIVEDEILEDIRTRAKDLSGITLAHVNATAFGGGVAEILDNLILLMNDVGIRTDWRVLHGTPEFFEVTKKLHNTLQGMDIPFTDQEARLYAFMSEKFSRFADLEHDCVFIHDPQPLPLGHFVEHSAPWIWRCHIDLTHPNGGAWDLVRPYVLEYDTMVVSGEAYRRPDVNIEQKIIHPSIDPLSPKNRELSPETIRTCLERENIPGDKPIVAQVSRFDPWKDPEGVLEMFLKVRKEVDCRLIFCYNLASDDPEGVRIYDRMLEAAKPYLEQGEVIFVRGDDPIVVNTIQRSAAVIVQKSTREGFGLVVTEAMWKGAAVVASRVGGIPIQIEDGVSGFLVEPSHIEECATKVIQLLKDKDQARDLGTQARERVRERFLITRHMTDHLELIKSLLNNRD
ncbi:MAG: glycosyltransferase [Fidelibacterota bacterium]